MNINNEEVLCIQRHIQKEVGQQRAVIAISGGIDSTVCAVLANRVLKDIYPLYIRTGFNLDSEEKKLKELFSRLNISYETIDKRDDFFSKLSGIEDPVKRRYNFGAISLKTIKEYARSVSAGVLINGVTKEDIIVSNIITDSNERIRDVKEVMGLKLVEPLAKLHKYEIKDIAEVIGLKELVHKQHIPGPALSVRIAGKITREKLQLLKDINELINFEVMSPELWQYFPFLLNEKLDGKYIVVLRFVTSRDGLRAAANFDNSLLKKICNLVLNEFPKVGRVFFDISPKPPATIEFM